MIRKILFVLALLLPQVAHAQYSEALNLAKKGNHRIFLVFTAEWCKSCDSLKEKVFTDKDIVSHIRSHYVTYFVDVDKDPATAKLYTDTKFLKGLPTCIIIDSDSHVCDQIDGEAPLEEFRTWLLDAEVPKAEDKPRLDFKHVVDKYVGMKGRLSPENKIVYMTGAGVVLFEISIASKDGKWFVSDRSQALPRLGK